MWSNKGPHTHLSRDALISFFLVSTTNIFYWYLTIPCIETRKHTTTIAGQVSRENVKTSLWPAMREYWTSFPTIQMTHQHSFAANQEARVLPDLPHVFLNGQEVIPTLPYDTAGHIKYLFQISLLLGWLHQIIWGILTRKLSIGTNTDTNVSKGVSRVLSMSDQVC